MRCPLISAWSITTPIDACLAKVALTILSKSSSETENSISIPNSFFCPLTVATFTPKIEVEKKEVYKTMHQERYIHGKMIENYKYYSDIKIDNV